MIYGANRHISKNVDYDAFIDVDDPEFRAFLNNEMEFPNVRINPADADLIAAAPEMYAAIDQIVTWLESGHTPTAGDLAEYIALLKKARGEL